MLVEYISRKPCSIDHDGAMVTWISNGLTAVKVQLVLADISGARTQFVTFYRQKLSEEFMNLNLKKAFLFSAAVQLSLISCAPKSLEGSKPNLVTQTQAVSDWNTFPYVIIMGMSPCGFNKIGKKAFITAAHCVTGGTGIETLSYFKPGGKVQYSHQPGVFGRTKLTTKKSSIHPDWTARYNAYQKLDETGAALSDEAWTKEVARILEKYYDIALVQVEEETPELPISKLMTKSLSVGQMLSLAGFGIYQFDSNPEIGLRDGRYRTGKNAVASLFQGMLTVSYDTGAYAGSGDSGSGAFVVVGGEVTITGVASGSYPGSKHTYYSRLDAGQKRKKDSLSWIAGELISN